MEKPPILRFDKQRETGASVVAEPTCVLCSADWRQAVTLKFSGFREKHSTTRLTSFSSVNHYV